MPRDKTREVTIVDVARLSGVSPSTVSNLLNGRHDRMRLHTQQRIEQAIEMLGYTPSQIARHLRAGRAPIIGLIVPSVANPFWGAMTRAVEEAALAHGYGVFLGNSERDPEREVAYAEEMFGQGIRSIVFGSSARSLGYLIGLIQRGLHIVAFDRNAQQYDQLEIDSVSIDNALGTSLATRHLLSLGHRRIAFISGPISTVSRSDRLQGFKSTMAEAGIAVDPELVWEGAMISTFGDIEGAQLGRSAARDLLQRADPPTAIVALNDMYALGACAGARDVGLRVPDDVSIVGFDDIVLADIAYPPITTVRQPLQDMTRVAVERLVARVEKTDSEGTVHRSFSPELIVRASTMEMRRAT